VVLFKTQALCRRSAAFILCAAAVALALAAVRPAIAAGQTPPAQASVHRARASTVTEPALSFADAIPYTDCSGTVPLARTAIYRDTCVPGVYLVAHNPGPFAGIPALNIGDRVSYRGQVYAVTSRSMMTMPAQWNEAHRHPADLTLQTCANDGLSRVWVIKGSTISN
jgi:hypothetical protein